MSSSSFENERCGFCGDGSGGICEACRRLERRANAGREIARRYAAAKRALAFARIYGDARVPPIVAEVKNHRAEIARLRRAA